MGDKDGSVASKDILRNHGYKPFSKQGKMFMDVRRSSPNPNPEDSSYFFSERRLSQLFNVERWTSEDEERIEDNGREPPPEPAPRGSYCPPSPGTAHAPGPVTGFKPGLPFNVGGNVGVSIGDGGLGGFSPHNQFSSLPSRGEYRGGDVRGAPPPPVFTDDMALGMSRLSKISSGSNLTADECDNQRRSLRYSRSSTVGDDPITNRGRTASGIQSSRYSVDSRYSALSQLTIETKSSRSSSSPLPTVLSDLVTGDEGMGDLLTEEGVARLGELHRWDDERESGDINWRERCLELELSLQRFRDQAGKIRELLREKLSELEHRVVEAESRARQSETKVRVMERQLANKDSPHSLGNGQLGGSPKEGSHPCSVGGGGSNNVDEIISVLSSQVEEQRQLRMDDAKKVEAKAAKIKDWVTNKLKELEEQNSVLREQNAKCNVQLQLLRGRLQHSGINDGSTDSPSSLPAYIGDSPPSRPATLGRKSKSRSPSNIRRASSSDTDSATHYSLHIDSVSKIPLLPEVDVRAISRDASREFGEFRDLKNSRDYKDSHDLRDFPRDSLNSCGSIEYRDSIEYQNSSTRDSKLDNSNSPSATSLHSISPRSPLEAMLNSLTQTSSLPRNYSNGTNTNSLRKPIPQPRTKHFNNLSGSPSPDNLDANRRISDEDGNSPLNTINAITKSINSLELDLSSSSNPTDQFDPSFEPLYKKLVKDEGHDYSEIYTPNSEGGWSVMGVPVDKPPTPPLHRFPSWESKIYQVAQKGLSMSDLGSDEKLNRNSSLGSYPEIHVPVYAAVKGRASQIRSMPFTGDSSDSSDGEEHCTSNPTPTFIEHRISSSHTPSSNESTSSSSPSKSKTSSLSPAKMSGSSPSKSVRRDMSFESGMSDDYAIPPDARSDTLSLNASHVTPLLSCRSSASCLETATTTLTNSHTCLTSPRQDTCLEKSGYLTKLGGKLKTWKKRFFVLKDGTLSYWKSQNEVHRKSACEISLSEGCTVAHTEGSQTFEICTGTKVYYLTADNHAAVEEWVRLLQNVLRRNATKLLLSREENPPTLQGWLKRVKHGHAKQSWCVLIGRMFVYFKHPSEQTPLGQLNMRDTRVEEVDRVSDSDGEETQEEPSDELTIGLFPSHQGPTYLICPTKQERDAWLYHLTIVSGGESNNGTQYEQLIQKLMELEGDTNCILWRHPLLLHTRDTLTSPFTTLSSDQLQAEAVKLYKSCQLYTSVLMNSSAIDYHVVLCQNALQLCLSVPELQPELYCGLIKQISIHVQSKLAEAQVGKTFNKIKHSRNLLINATQSLFLGDSSGSHKTSAFGSSNGSGIPFDPKINSPSFAFTQAWQFLSLAISLFVPKNNKLLWYLKIHLHRYADPKSEFGKYAIYCQRALERTLTNGGREAKPSRMEVLSLLLKNPYHHSLPHAIPVHLLNGTYQVVGFDGSTTIEEFLHSLNLEICCRDGFSSGFALFSDDPIEKDLEHCLNHNAKLCDVISKWETALREKGSGKFENTKVIRLLFKNRLYFRSSSKSEMDKEKLLLCYQTNHNIQLGKFPVTKELAMELTTLMAQIDMNEVNTERSRGSGSGGPSAAHVLQIFNKFYPKRYRDEMSKEETKSMLDSLQEKWLSLRGRSQGECIRIFLTCARKWAHFGSMLFPATTTFADSMDNDGSESRLNVASPSSGKACPIWVAVSEDSITLLEKGSMQTIVRYSYSNVVTFGGCQQDFMLVVHTPELDSQSHGTQKLLLCMTKPKILELTLLIADYMNALGRGVPGTPHGTLTRHGSHRSARATHLLPGQPDLLQMTSEIDKREPRKRANTETSQLV